MKRYTSGPSSIAGWRTSRLIETRKGRRLWYPCAPIFLNAPRIEKIRLVEAFQRAAETPTFERKQQINWLFNKDKPRGMKKRRGKKWKGQLTCLSK